MYSKKVKCFVLGGPTATGKTIVAQLIAEQTGRTILSADSMLVYKGMDIGTAKPVMHDCKGVTYLGMDIVTPDMVFSVWDYIEYVRQVVKDGSQIIVVGGTGLYLKCLTSGIKSVPGGDSELRARWAQIVSENGIVPLQQELLVRYPEVYTNIADKQNPRRLIRALEIVESSTNNSNGDACRNETNNSVANMNPVSLTMPMDRLTARIESRVDTMYRNGLVDEVKQLMVQYQNLSPTALQAIGYAEAMSLIKGECTIDEAKARTVTRTRRLAKRQMTWFRHQMNVQWIEVASDSQIHETADNVMRHWAETGPLEIDL